MDAASGWCEGCLRTLDEIAAWSQLDEEAKRAVWAQLEARRVARAADASSARDLSGPGGQGGPSGQSGQGGQGGQIRHTGPSSANAESAKRTVAVSRQGAAR